MTKPAAKPAPNPSPEIELFAGPVRSTRPAERLFPVNDGPLFSPEHTTPRRRRTARKTAKATTAPQLDTPAPSWIASARPLATIATASTDEPAGRSITAIETRYAGCRFRSRLEARWAVFFDHLGIRWEYEPETYLVGPFGSRRGYLPDFYLPEQDLWIEVKGDPAALDYDLLIAAANPMTGLPVRLDPVAPCSGWGLQKLRLLILGPVPAAPGGMHKGLSVLGGELVAAQYSMPYCDWLGGEHGHWTHGFTCIGPACSLPPHDPPRTIGPTVDVLNTAITTFLGCQHAWNAYTAARSARFEHGESG